MTVATIGSFFCDLDIVQDSVKDCSLSLLPSELFKDNANGGSLTVTPKKVTNKTPKFGSLKDTLAMDVFLVLQSWNSRT